MEFIGEFLPSRKNPRRRNPFIAGISGAVNRRVHDGGFLADIFHDVDFSRLRPLGCRNRPSQHPKRRPDALPPRNPDPRLDFSVLYFIKTLRLDAARGVLAGAGSDGADHQVSASVQKYILPAVRIILKLLIPAFGSKIEGPFGRVWTGTGGTVELVAPHLSPIPVLDHKGGETDKKDGQSFHHTKRLTTPEACASQSRSFKVI